MTLNNINVEVFIADTLKRIESDPEISPSLKATIQTLIMLIQLLLERFGKNSRNSSVPPAMDPNRTKQLRNGNSCRPRGGQFGHVGTTLTKVDNPDEVIIIKASTKDMPEGIWRIKGYVVRQVVELELNKRIVEYRAEVLVNQDGLEVTASFPGNVIKAVQYGESVKVQATYLSQYQLIPYERITEHFADQYGIPISAGTVNNILSEAYLLLDKFEKWLIDKLRQELVLNLDETGVNIGGERKWLHVVCSTRYTYYLPHDKRGSEAIDATGILPQTKAILCHDHWKPYFNYSNPHALCNAHYLRELEAAKEEGQKWSQDMSLFLLGLNDEVDASGGVLSLEKQEEKRCIYRQILAYAEEECPEYPPDALRGKRGRTAKTKSRNLLERFRDFESSILRFMTDVNVPFSNNLAENDLRMTKVQQKISGCFRSFQGALTFCRVRGYLSTCRKHGITATYALQLLFAGKLPDFVTGE